MKKTNLIISILSLFMGITFLLTVFFTDTSLYRLFLVLQVPESYPDLL